MIKLTTILLIILPLNNISDNEWKLEKNKNNIQVYTYLPEDSDVKEIRMTSTANVNLSQAVAVLTDINNYTKWIYNCSSAKILKEVKENEVIYYSVTKAPWPVLDRDLVVHNRIFQHPTTKAVFSESKIKTGIMPKISGRVRIIDMYGLWKFTPIEKNKIEIEYYIKVDPAGKLPGWVVNMFIANGPYQSMVKFKEQLKQEEYKNQKFNFIKD